MQTLANYLLVAANTGDDASDTLRQDVLATIDHWLDEKGVADPSADTGTFASRTEGASGRYFRNHTAGEDAALAEVRLEEPAGTGQTFSTTISVVSETSRLLVYVHLSVKNASGIIAPILTDPRCPAVIKRLFQLTDRWSFGGKDLPLPIPTAARGEDAGRLLAAKVMSEFRAIPIIVVSEIEGQAVWEGIAERLASDLTALAEVVTVDEAAAWALTSVIGKLRSCYRGAIRLYWPVRLSANDGAFPHSPVWTATTLLSNDYDGNGVMRFRATLRRTIMSVAALTIEAPPELSNILYWANRKQIADLEARASSKSDELEIAKMFLADNEQLRKEIADTKRELAHWINRAEAAEYGLSAKVQPLGEIGESSEEDDETAPGAGEVRFYKKTHSTPFYDVLVPVKDCRHATWQPGNKAEKAKKGLQKLLGESDAWKSLQHCGTCTGGGMWRVRW